MPSQLDRRVRIHAALADPIRLAMVDELALSDRSPTELAGRFGVRSNLLAHHLDVLEDAGLIERIASHGDRRRRYVRLAHEALSPLTTAPALHAGGVMFVCTRNSARSQLAAAVWNASSVVQATSAGTEPADRVHREAVRAARRRGLDLSGAVPSLLDPERFDDRLVVTVCDLAHEELAMLSRSSSRSGLPVLHWSIPDPAESGRPADFDAVTETIEQRVRSLAPCVVPA